VLALNVNYMYKLDAWLVAGGRRRQLLDITERTSFAGRPTDDLHLAAPFALGPGEAGAIYISYWSAGATAMPVAIETPESFAERNASANAVHAASYAALGVFIGLSLLLAAIARSRLFVLYAIYIGSVLLFIMHADGAAFRYLWPNLPQWNAFASLALGAALNITAALFTRAFLGTAQNYPRFDKAFLAVIVASALTIVVGIFFERAARIVVYPLVFAAALVFLSGGVAALRDRRPGALYYVIGWATISFAALIALAVNTPFSTNYITFDLVRGSIMVDALMMTLALMARAHGDAGQYGPDRPNKRPRATLCAGSDERPSERAHPLERIPRHAPALAVAAARRAEADAGDGGRPGRCAAGSKPAPSGDARRRRAR
jgi:hypothetical protein